MKDGEVIAVLDAGPLIHLDEIGSLHFLEGFREILLPELVEQEAVRHRPKIRLDSIPSLVRVRTSFQPDNLLVRLATEFGLHAGELAAISALKEHNGNCLLSDDAAARAMAEAIGFEVRGTVGLILRSWRHNQITKQTAIELLKSLPQKSTLHLRPGFLRYILVQLGE